MQMILGCCCTKKKYIPPKNKPARADKSLDTISSHYYDLLNKSAMHVTGQKIQKGKIPYIDKNTGDTFWYANNANIPKHFVKNHLLANVLDNFQQIAHKIDKNQIPEEFLDPIFQTLLVKPVLTEYGTTYSSATIKEMIVDKKMNFDPLNRQVLTKKPEFWIRLV